MLGSAQSRYVGSRGFDKAPFICLSLGSAWIVFGATFFLMFWLTGHRLTFTNIDAGIYLDAGKRVAEGQVPFRDFFFISGPATPWIMGLSMKLFGVNLPAAQVMLVFDLSLMAMLVFWMTRKICSSMQAAIIAAFLFVAFSTAQPSMLVANHRWDSAAAGLAATALTWLTRERSGRFTAILAGLSCAIASWATPSVALLAITLSLWFLWDKHLRRVAVYFFSGLFAGLLAGLLFLQSQGALFPMIDHLFWIVHNYAKANRVVYGQVIGGYGALVQGTSGLGLIIVFIILLFLSLPAWMPPLTTIGWIIRLSIVRQFGRCFEVLFLLSCGAALVIAQAPKLDLGHLLFAMPIFYTLAISLVTESFVPRKCKMILALIFLVAAGVSFRFTLANRLDEIPTLTRAGVASMDPKESSWLTALEQHVNAGDSLFVFPYMPSLYFALDARNPTQYCFLQPGMSSKLDEAKVLVDLRSTPPHWVIHMLVEPEAYLRIWPSSDRSRLHMTTIEQFIKASYSEVTRVGPFNLMHYSGQ